MGTLAKKTALVGSATQQGPKTTARIGRQPLMTAFLSRDTGHWSGMAMCFVCIS